MKLLSALNLALMVLVSCNREAPPELTAVLHNVEEIELFSLDPGDSLHPPNKPGTFFGYEILGKTVLTASRDRQTLVDAFEKGIREAVPPYACFQPRHGIVVQREGNLHAYLICFACGSFYLSSGGETKNGLVSGTPQAAFDELLTKAGVKLAKKAGAP